MAQRRLGRHRNHGAMVAHRRVPTKMKPTGGGWSRRVFAAWPGNIPAFERCGDGKALSNKGIP